MRCCASPAATTCRPWVSASIEGRLLDDQRRGPAAPVAVINETLAKLYFPKGERAGPSHRA